MLLFDAGTGLRPFGNALIKNSAIRDVDIFLTHCHLDHVVGLPFFAPFFAESQPARYACAGCCDPARAPSDGGDPQA
jgi:phosphoribosyl 1,2-cyclic phosphodiesterase